MVSIVVLAYNKAAYTRACLQSVLQTQPPDLEMIVVDNGSTDETPRMLDKLSREGRTRGIPVRVLRQEENLGCSTARNMAVSAAAGEEIVFLDNDTIVPDPAWLEKMRSVLRSEKNAAIVGPKLCYPVEPHLIQCAGVGVSRSGRVLFRGRGEPADRFAHREEVQALISACFMFPRSLYDEIGGLDEAFNPIQYEDFDFCYRARSRGYRVIYTPDPVIYHWESVTSTGSAGGSRLGPGCALERRIGRSGHTCRQSGLPTGSAAIPNRYVIIKHGMLFKKRWRHMFEKEDGPSDEETRWRSIEMPSPEGERRSNEE